MKEARTQIKSNLAGLLVFVGLMMSWTVQADECQDLEGEALTVCLTLVVCTSIDDKRARNQCLEVARQIMDKREQEKSGETEEVVEESLVDESKTEDSASSPVDEQAIEEVHEPKEVPTLVDTPISTQTPETDTGSASVTDESETDEENSERRFLFFFKRDIERKRELGISDKVFSAVYEIDPEQFSSTVVGVKYSDRNQAVVVLDNGVVFEVKRARQSRIKVDDVIVATKRRGFGSKRSYTLYGRAASVDALRVRCEHLDPVKTTVQRCAYASSLFETE